MKPAHALVARLKGAGPGPVRLMAEQDLAMPEVDEALMDRAALCRQVYG